MIKKRFVEMPEGLENKIVELAYTIKRLGLSNTMFEYFNDRDKEIYKVYITEYKYGWEVVHLKEGYARVSKSQRDMYVIKANEKELVYDYSEED